MILFKPCFSACLSAKPSEESVFPPPVGTVMEKRPRGSSAFSNAYSRMFRRSRLTSVSGAVFCFSSMKVWYCSHNASMEEKVSGRAYARFGFINASVASQSASTREEKSIRTHKAALRFASFIRKEGTIALGFPGGVSGTSTLAVFFSSAKCELRLLASPTPSGSPV